MACEVNNKEVNSQCAELLVRPSYMYPSTIILLFDFDKITSHQKAL